MVVVVVVACIQVVGSIKLAREHQRLNFLSLLRSIYYTETYRFCCWDDERQTDRHTDRQTDGAIKTGRKPTAFIKRNNHAGIRLYKEAAWKDRDVVLFC